jgi:IclR family acetate operon transcriptional repressor
MQNNPAPKYQIGSVDNALRLLRLYRDRRLVRVTDAAEELGVGRSTAHRLLATLQHHGFVEQDPETRAYRAGAALAEIGLATIREDGLGEHMRPYMVRLRDEVNETIQLVVLRGANCLFIETVESTRPLRTASRVGVVVPAHCLSGGKALLARMPLERLHRLYPTEEIPAATPRSITSRTALEGHLDEVRARGYATNFGESEEEIGSIGVAVVGPRGRARAGLAVSGPLSRVHDGDPEQVATIVMALQRIAREASASLASAPGR